MEGHEKGGVTLGKKHLGGCRSGRGCVLKGGVGVKELGYKVDSKLIRGRVYL